MTDRKVRKARYESVAERLARSTEMGETLVEARKDRIGTRKLVDMALQVVGFQVDRSCKHSVLAFGVFEQAAKDAVEPSPSKDRGYADALRYLCGDIPHLGAIDIDPDWARYWLKEAGLDVFERWSALLATTAHEEKEEEAA